MGFKITLTVRHIRGRSFDIECARDADALGIKVLIWESQKIPIDKQRIIFAGREMGDHSTLAELEIVDGSTIFLVETGNANNNNATGAVSVVENENPPLVEVTVDKFPESFVNVPAVVPSAARAPYAYLDEDSASELRIAQVVGLSKWVRAYLLLGIIVSFWMLYHCLFYCFFGTVIMGIICLVYITGFVAGRRLHRCLLILPALLVGMIGFFGLTLALYIWVAYLPSPWMLIPVTFTAMHIAIFSCICKLMTRIGQLTSTEFMQARARIRNRCCLC